MILYLGLSGIKGDYVLENGFSEKSNLTANLLAALHDALVMTTIDGSIYFYVFRFEVDVFNVNPGVRNTYLLCSDDMNRFKNSYIRVSTDKKYYNNAEDVLVAIGLRNSISRYAKNTVAEIVKKFEWKSL